MGGLLKGIPQMLCGRKYDLEIRLKRWQLSFKDCDSRPLLNINCIKYIRSLLKSLL